MGRAAAAKTFGGSNRRSRSALVNTKTLDSAMAPRPSIGDSSVPLTDKARQRRPGSTPHYRRTPKRDCAMLRIVARESASAAEPREVARHQHHIAASMATSVPVPMAIPASAAASAGASLTPSPRKRFFARL